MNIEGLAALVFAAMVMAFTATLAILSGDAFAVGAVWLGIGAAYCAQVCFYSFVHVRGAAGLGILFWVASIGLHLVSFATVMI